MTERSTSDQRPFKVVAYEPGAAHVVNRKSGERIGYVLNNYYDWSAYLCSAPGVQLVFGQRRNGPRLAEILGPVSDVVETRLRADAAMLVWKEATTDGR